MNVTADMIIEPGMVDSFFTVFGVLVTGLVTSFTVVGLCIYKPEEEVPYEKKYHDEFAELEARDMTEDEVKGLSKIFIEDETPKGVVKMCYSYDTDSYHYWCDDKGISFLYLDAIAQKYAIENDCKKVCVDYKEEYDKAVERVKEYLEKKDNNEEEDSTEEEDEEDKKRSVFAKFKSYNTVNKEQTSDDKKKESIQVENANKFRYKGKLVEWSDPEEEVKDEKQLEKLSLSDWLRNRKSVDDNMSEDNDKNIEKDVELKKEK